MYCCVIVDPPCTSPPRAITHNARNIPDGEIPPSVQNVRFSAATAAFFSESGISSYGIVCRFCDANEPSFSPSRQVTNDVLAWNSSLGSGISVRLYPTARPATPKIIANSTTIVVP